MYSAGRFDKPAVICRKFRSGSLKRFGHRLLFLSLSCLFAFCDLPAQTPEFVSLASARPVLQALHASLPPELAGAGALTPAAWDQWVRAKDRQIRSRVAPGEELTLTNLLRLGISYTRERRITYDLLDRYGRDPIVNSTAERRADDLIRALSASQPSPGLLQMRAFLMKSGFSLATPENRKKTKAYLLASLARQRDEVARDREQSRTGHSQLFKDRGLSTDSDLYTAYTLELHLRDLLQRGLLKPGNVHRVAIVGPGLDFVNKKDFGYDFYPPQTTQPFALIDSLLRLGLSHVSQLDVSTFDISPWVNQHIARARAQAASGKPYTIQLLRSRSMGGNADFLHDFARFWESLGDQVGMQVQPLAVPEAARSDVVSRAVSIPPDVVARVTPVDMNVILQIQRRPADRRFDLVIGTNIFLYYDTLEQALARANLATMIRPGGFLISNTALAPSPSSMLVDSVQTDIPIRPGLTDYVYSYQRQP
jgi:hypothetical protein